MSFYLQKPSDLEIKPDVGEWPAALKTDVEKQVGANITKAHIQYGGYSAAFSCIAKTEDGKTYFIKGSHPAEMSHGAKTLAQEIHIYKSVDILKEISPAFIGQAHYGGEDDWRLGIWQALQGPGIKTSWTDQDFKYFGETMKKLYTEFDPDKADVLPADQTNFIKDIISGKNSWQKFTAFEDRKDQFCSIFEDQDAARAWLDSHLPQLIKDSRSPVDHFQTLVHFDLRHDNILFDEAGSALLIDWPNGCIAPAGYDLVCLSCDLMAHGNGDAWDIFKKLSDTQTLNISESDVIAILSKISGYYALNAYREIPDRLPRLRWIQKAFLYCMTEWLARLNHIDSLPRMAL